MKLTKEFLAIYLLTAAREDGTISSPEGAAELEKKLLSWDPETFESLLTTRRKSLRDMATGQKEKGLFSAEYYGSQAATLDGLIRALPEILSS